MGRRNTNTTTTPSRNVVRNAVQRSKFFNCQQFKLLPMRLLLLYLTILVGLTSCKKDKLDINSFWQCNQSQNLDTPAISNKLSGSWTWTKQSCSEAGKTKSADRNIKVTFDNNHTFSVTENSNSLTQGTWKLTQVDGNSWGLDISSPGEYLSGRILFCDNDVLFNDSYRDGCDNLFTKIN